MQLTTESLMLSSLVLDEEFVRQTLPYLRSEYFHDKNEKIIFEIIKNYLQKYNTLPNKTTLIFDVREKKELNDSEYESISEYINNIYKLERPTDQSWLVKQAEEFCQNKAIYNAIVQSIEIYDGKSKDYTTHAIPQLIKEAIGVNFDNHVGMDFFDDIASRYEYYSKVENKVAFDIDILNLITGGGVSKKTLNLILAGVFVGKSLTLVHLAAAYAKAGYNVLYISMEMREEEVFKRIDANMLKIPTDKIADIGFDKYNSKIEKLKQKSYGKIKVKEYAPCSAHAGHFNNLLQELKLKQRFTPDVILVDYLGIVASSRQKSASAGSHTYLTSVAEELRALAFEYDVPLWSAP
ncbi:MAG: DnaB-like helicase C-terminal domain-containing protein, partial [Flavobacterium sp.]|uniref:DnaB-like helicase C-terminal domain-containing protein n=1 Tax=Flavobacterium sp. TaxID=239 RepID=UPI002624A9EF